MGQSRCLWAIGIAAPWCLGLGLMVSFTAVAGQDPVIGAGAPPPAQERLRLAALQLGDKADLIATPDEIEPRKELKAGVKSFPLVDRSRRGDPVIGLRPTLDTRLRKSSGLF